jgi:hypothetical protein
MGGLRRLTPPAVQSDVAEPIEEEFRANPSVEHVPGTCIPSREPRSITEGGLGRIRAGAVARLG